MAAAASPTAATPPAATAATTLRSNAFGRDMFGISSGGAIQDEPASQLASDLSIDHSLGAKWIRITLNWSEIQPNGPSSYDWSRFDAVVQGAEADGMSVLGVIEYTPFWDRPAGTSANYAPSPGSYAAFVSAAVAHYAVMGVNAYEVWNEENNVASWTPAPSPSAYTALIRAAYPAIHAADPSATVLVGGLSPANTDGTNYAPEAFLAAMYANGAKGYFDAVGAHPYCWPANPGEPEVWSAWYQTYGAAVSLRSLMIANGDGGKRIWGTEFGAPTNGPPGTFVTEAQQARMITDAYRLWRGYSWAGPLFVFETRDEGTDTSTDQNFYGLTDYSGVPKPAYTAYQRAAATL